MPPVLTMMECIGRGILPVPDARLAAEWYAGEFEFQIARRGSREIDLMLGEGEISITMIRMKERIHRKTLQGLRLQI